ncbi:MAG: hypothetical protein JNL67_11640 [Planctomycetaceae bacterium]|nr:hypothetical protein [Planctomycetaceae bacterium]
MSSDSESNWCLLPDAGRFVILEHQVPLDSGRADHWDVMLETATGLQTWATQPFASDGASRQVEELPLHRSIYLDYEGPISGNRGCVRRLDRGKFRILDRQSRWLLIQLAGDVYQGRLQVRLANDGKSWFTWESSAFDLR